MVVRLRRHAVGRLNLALQRALRLLLQQLLLRTQIARFAALQRLALQLNARLQRFRVFGVQILFDGDNGLLHFARVPMQIQTQPVRLLIGVRQRAFRGRQLDFQCLQHVMQPTRRSVSQHGLGLALGHCGRNSGQFNHLRGCGNSNWLRFAFGLGASLSLGLDSLCGLDILQLRLLHNGGR